MIYRLDTSGYLVTFASANTDLEETKTSVSLYLDSFPDPQAKRREVLGDSLTSMHSGGIHGM